MLSYRAGAIAAYRHLHSLPPYPVGDAALRDIISRADLYLREINDGEVDDPSVGLYRDNTLIQLIKEIEALPASNPSRAGEISPALRWVKALKERIAFLIQAEKNAIIDIDGIPVGSHARQVSWNFIHELGHRKNELQDILKLIEAEEATPHPAPEVKEEDKTKTPFRCCFPWSPRCETQCAECKEFIEPVKDTPVEQIDPHEEWVEATTPPDKEGHYNVITEANCFLISAYEMGDWGYNRETDEMVSMAGMGMPDRVARYRPSTYQPFLDELEDLDERPAGVPDTNVGEIPELTPSEENAYVIMGDGTKSRTLGELFQLIPQEHRRKIMGATGPGTSLCAVLEYVARYTDNLRQKLAIVQQSKQVLIDDLAEKSDEAGEYRKALQKETDEWVHGVTYETHEESVILLAKYPNP